MTQVALLATGGTIATRTSPAGLAVAATASELLESTVRPPEATVTPVDIAGRLSSATTTDDLLDLARSVAEHARAQDAIVVTHGTDTLEETAFLLALTHHCDIPVILTGAQEPIDHPEADGPVNLAAALAWSVLGQPGVTVAFAGEIWPAIGIRKLHTTAAHAFEVPDTAPLATLGPSGIVTHRQPNRPPPQPIPRRLPRVEVIPQYLGADTAVLDAAVRAGARGLVIAAFGHGNTTPELTRRCIELLGHGMPIAVASRVPAGPVHGLYAGAGAALSAAGALMATGLTTWQARLLLATTIANQPDDPIGAARRWLTAATECLPSTQDG
jgi:L-asparaginase